MPEDFYKTKEKINDYVKAAKDVDGRQLITKFKRFLPAQSTVLELGSGPGTDWRILQESYRVTGSDFSEAFLEHLRETIPHGEFIKIDASNIPSDTIYQGIYSNKVLHHLTDKQLQQSIQSQHQALKEGGIVCHSFWKGNGTDDFNGMFVNYHSADELRALFGDLFDILLLESYQEFEVNDSLLLIANKK